MRKISALLLLLLPAVCVEASDLRTAAFIHYGDTVPWMKAQAMCRETHTDLVTIRENENEDFYSGGGWIGLYRENSTSKWKWSRRDETADFTMWKDRGRDSVENSAPDEPKVDENCAFKYRDTHKWQSDPCHKDHSYMCYEERLVLVKENKTWEQALQHCRALEAVDPSKPATDYQNHHYDLATLLTPDDHIYAREKAQAATTNAVWTGLRYLAGQWVWVGGEEVQYQDIKRCPTHRFCGTLVKNRTKPFKIRFCGEKRNFLCYRKT